MTIVEQFARIERKVRPLTVRLNPVVASWIISNGRKVFLSLLANDKPHERIHTPPSFRKKLWDINFNLPLFNAAGMFKNGEGYYTIASQGAGAYLAGTSTVMQRTGNSKNNIKHPVAYLPKSGMAVNWMGLPNHGHAELAKKLNHIEKIEGCPVGASISTDPSQSGQEALKGIIIGLDMFTKAQVDFIELNESCPNVEHEEKTESINGIDKSLIDRLEFISKIRKQSNDRFVPLIVKFSNDTTPEQIPELINILLTLRFDGVNFGNTSTDYVRHREILNENDLKLFDYFTQTFGGGVSGTNLKSSSFALCSAAVNSIANLNPSHEFHVIRTGGIEDTNDLDLSLEAGISLNQWFTGYFDSFAKFGHNLYEHIFNH